MLSRPLLTERIHVLTTHHLVRRANHGVGVSLADVTLEPTGPGSTETHWWSARAGPLCEGGRVLLTTYLGESAFELGVVVTLDDARGERRRRG